MCSYTRSDFNMVIYHSLLIGVPIVCYWLLSTTPMHCIVLQVLLEYAHYLAQVRNTYRSGYKGQGSYLHPTIEEDPTDRSVLLT